MKCLFSSSLGVQYHQCLWNHNTVLQGMYNIRTEEYKWCASVQNSVQGRIQRLNKGGQTYSVGIGAARAKPRSPAFVHSTLAVRRSKAWERTLPWPFNCFWVGQGFVSRSASRKMRGCVQGEVQLVPLISCLNEATHAESCRGVWGHAPPGKFWNWFGTCESASEAVGDHYNICGKWSVNSGDSSYCRFSEPLPFGISVTKHLNPWNIRTPPVQIFRNIWTPFEIFGSRA